MDVEEAFQVVGDYGRLQRHVFWSMAIPQIFIAWNHMLNVFVGSIPKFYCSQTLLRSTDTTIYVFDESEFTSIASEWDLVCDSAYKTDLAQSIFMAGLLAGNFIGGYIADTYGRKSVCYVGILGLFFLGCGSLAAPTFEYYILLRLAAGVAAGAYGLVSFTLPAELVGSSHRGYVNVVMSVAFAFGIFSLPILAFFVRDWRLLTFITSLPGLVGVYYYFYTPESPRWLLSQGRTEEAENTMLYIWDVNKPATHASSSSSKRIGSGHLVSWLDMIKSRNLLCITLNNMFTWFVGNILYYGLTLKMGDFNGNKYINVSIAGLVEVPASVVTLFLMDRYGRKPTYTHSLFVSSVMTFIITFLGSDGTFVSTLLALIGKTCISVSVCVCWMHATEMYPTNIRNKALSICSMFGRFGGVVAPLILTLGRSYQGLDFFIFASSCLLAAGISRKLPETLHKSLPETMEDMM
ncbi:hypothetical protein HELRODRAFT_111410 [Helobdella robusta]|uniref:Major facilitator superfamily (MFS) profile domain-containing protein n=1 Tax=Helobdella robusta TaxID=6412 RepID=T1EFB0_HELRO|nr:hypothetical protein HELRODRAFT_111410 [Helobdella robusta]ESO04946.1 hypothetical protein HELRODRAFT_111410 [Helobdella robusta]